MVRDMWSAHWSLMRDEMGVRCESDSHGDRLVRGVQ